MERERSRVVLNLRYMCTKTSHVHKNITRAQKITRNCVGMCRRVDCDIDTDRDRDRVTHIDMIGADTRHSCTYLSYLYV